MEKVRVAYIGDSPFMFSGFGVVAKAILSRFDKEEFDVSVLGAMFTHYPKEGQREEIPAMGYYAPVCVHDSMGFKASIDFIQYVNPDVLFLLGDPGTLRNRFSAMMITGMAGALPAVSYFPLEGAPFSPHIVEQANMVHSPVTYTKWGSDLIGVGDGTTPGPEVDWIWHGVDHAPFEKYSDDVRDRLRELVGWKDRFVVTLVGVNKRPNRQPVLIEAARILRDRGRDDFIIYMHCQAKGDQVMGGWDLPWMITAYDVEDQVRLKPTQSEPQYIGRPRTGTLEEVLNQPLPKSDKEASDNLAMLDFVSLLNLPNLYLDPASSHGFNLPAAEAARCGVPVATVDDKFARTEIFGGCAYMMVPSASDYWHTGAALPLVSPNRIADTIEKFWDDEGLRKAVASSCKQRFDACTWEPVAQLFQAKIMAAYDWGLEMSGVRPSVKRMKDV